jgi:cytoskeletal protein RodZ
MLDQNAGYPSSEPYGSSSCSSTPPGSSKDTAQHYHHPKKHLSGGAIAGIVVGVVVFVLLIILVFILVWRKKHPKTKSDSEGDSGEKKAGPARSEPGWGCLDSILVRLPRN